ncbi:DUF6053 domain-containing protein [Lysobacter sp. TAB13]|uniref:DUF6053 domain-containing protein n=1 Tax=Lysobacter sp. TAB13 TaxID=3233065 RepID=UPI003F9C7809
MPSAPTQRNFTATCNRSIGAEAPPTKAPPPAKARVTARHAQHTVITPLSPRHVSCAA